ncbi:hypothetical protein AYO44_00965 [Planctomycetaceae bacterium SCGC AG-212-F19]|nr:hypothetical protein AYO44_00965 [Planctomycetaceae bacterium SCGC AG-212-F19]
MKYISRFLGLDTELDSTSDWSFRLADLWEPTWPLLVLLVVLIVYYGWQYRRDAQRLSSARRWLLTSLRLAAVGLAVLMLLKPALSVAHTEKRTPVVAVLVDESLSMAYPDARNHPLVPAGGTRAERSRFAVAREAASRLLEQGLTKDHRVVVYKFSGNMERIAEFAAGDAKPQAALVAVREALTEPTGTHTNPGDALVDVLRDLAGNKVAGIVLISDGRSTATPQSGAVTLDEAARRFKQAGVPVSTVATGTVEPLRDLALVDLAAPKEANLEDTLSMRLTVVNHIEPGLQTELTLLEDGKPKVVRKVRLNAGRNDITLSLIVEGQELGDRKYTIKAPRYEDELTYDNNEISAHVRIVKRGLRCLFIAGKPTVEYHYLWPALARDPIINVSCWLLDADVNYTQQGKTPIDKLPQSLEDWNKYDVVVLYDVDPEKITNEQETGLENLIRNGGGLFVIAGRNHGLDALLTVRSAKMGAMLPVEIDRNKHPDYNQVFQKPFKPARTKEGRQHPIFLFDPDPQANDKVWGSFPEMYWAHPTLGIKPRATSLLENPDAGADADGKVLMALWRYGEGAVFYSGVDALWRWRYPYENFDHNRFFSQIIRYLGETRLLGSQKQVVLQTDQKLYSPGGAVQVSLSVLDPSLLAQLRNENLLATVTDPQGGAFKVALNLKGQTFIGQYRPKRIGEYVVQTDHTLADASSAQKKVFDETARFDVRLQSLEDLDTTADLEGMARLAQLTGGRSYDHTSIKNLGELPGTFSPEPQLIPHRTEEDIWDSPLFLLLFLGTITSEWVLRKKWSLL